METPTKMTQQPVERDSARARRRERRRLERDDGNMEPKHVQPEQKESNNDVAFPPKKRDRHAQIKNETSDSKSVSSSSCSSDSTVSSTMSPQHEILEPTKRSGKKKRRGKKPSKKRNKMEVEIVSEQETVKYLALDCEMVGVGKYGERSALARVSIVNWEGDVVLDKYVKVAEPVTDYRTFVSGIRAEDLESDEAMDFDECCDLVANTLKDKIVVGHALRNDFDVMNIRLPWYMIRDTAKYEPLMKLDPKDPGQLVAKRLRDLAAENLNLMIQREGQEHCSVEDAGAAMELYKQARKKWEQVIEYKLNKTRAIQEQKQRELLMSYEKSQLSTEKVSMPTISCS